MDSVTLILLELNLPSFKAAIYNSLVSFSEQCLGNATALYSINYTEIRPIMVICTEYMYCSVLFITSHHITWCRRTQTRRPLYPKKCAV